MGRARRKAVSDSIQSLACSLNRQTDQPRLYRPLASKKTKFRDFSPASRRTGEIGDQIPERILLESFPARVPRGARRVPPKAGAADAPRSQPGRQATRVCSFAGQSANDPGLASFGEDGRGALRVASRHGFKSCVPRLESGIGFVWPKSRDSPSVETSELRKSGGGRDPPASNDPWGRARDFMILEILSEILTGRGEEEPGPHGAAGPRPRIASGRVALVERSPGLRGPY